MKLKKKSILLGTGTGLLLLTASLSAQPFSEGALSKNRAVLSSPRTLEQFPELLRAAPLQTTMTAEAKSGTERLAKLKENRSRAASPRFLEEHPELLRPQASAEQLLAHATEKRERLFELKENRALVASPRFQEEHPEVLRSTSEVQIAPLK